MADHSRNYQDLLDPLGRGQDTMYLVDLKYISSQTNEHVHTSVGGEGAALEWRESRVSSCIQNPLVHINIIIYVISIHSLVNILTGHLFHQEQSFPTQWDFNNNSNHNATTGVFLWWEICHMVEHATLFVPQYHWFRVNTP